MSNLLNLSGKIDPLLLALFERLTDVAGALGIRFFVVGATARDLIFELGHGLRSKRATKDVDVGVRVSGWGDFEKLKEALLAGGDFTQTREVQRFLYRRELLLDILPFGGIAHPKSEIRWPPDEHIAMTVVGFEDAYEAAQHVTVRADPPLDILVASPAGLAIMKIIAWADRPDERSRDAQDLAHVLENYLDIGNYERLLEDHMDLVEVEKFDYARAGARLLGRDIATIGKPETVARIKEILAGETAEDAPYRLIRAMVADSLSAVNERGNRFEELLTALRELMAGINER
jgi:predicted nucleotidyltransferase